jgi:hypothetical protein
VRLVASELGISGHRPVFGQRHLRKQLDAVTRRHDKTQPPPEPRLLAGRHLLDLGAGGVDPANELRSVSVATLNPT